MRKINFALIALFFALALEGAHNFEKISADVLGARTSESLSPTGRLVAFASAASGIQLIDSRTGHKTLLASANANQPVFSWSADDRYLVVGNSSEVQLFLTGSGRRLAAFDGHVPQISPDGRKIAFVRDHNLWIADAKDGAARTLTETGSANTLVGEPDLVFGREFDIERHYWWSPDSSSIAFIEMEFQNADHYVLPGEKLPLFRLKVLDLKTGNISLLEQSTGEWPYLLRVSWHPDSQRVVFYRMNRPQTAAELCLAEGKAIRTLETEKDRYWVNVPETPLVVNDGKGVVVSSERTGARHVYLYGIDGELQRDLTPNGMEVTQLHRSLTPRGVYVSGSIGDHQEMQLFELPLKGGAPKQVTPDPGWHDVTLDSKGDTYLDDYSTSMRPPVLMWHREGVPERRIFATEMAQKAVTNEFLLIKTHDNVALPARLYKPGDFDAKKKYPVILYTFSGPRGRVVKDAWDGWQMAWNREMVRSGYLVLAVDVRGSGGYGHSFEEYIHYRFGAQEVADLREVVSYLQQLSYVDRTRLGIWGCDYGAHTVVHAMLEFPDGFEAGFADSPIIEWTRYDAYFTERYLGLPGDHTSEYKDSTALDDARRMTGTLMVVSSGRDPLIRDGQTEALRKAMAKVRKNKSVIDRLHVLAEDDPYYRENASQMATLMNQMAVFFESTLIAK